MTEKTKSACIQLANGNPSHSLTGSLRIQQDNKKYALMDHEFFERNQSVVREKVPERLVHAKGMSVKGYFIAENSEMDKYTSAKFLHKSDYKTPVVCRFSTTSGSLGSADAVRDTHGMGVRFYNKHSGCNVDFVALHLPVFAIYDAMKFASKVHSGKPDPKTGISTPCSGLDFFSQTPESSGAFVMNYSDRGIPRSWRHIDGYSVNTFKLRNNKDEVHYCRWEFDTLEGTQFLTNEQARALAVKPDAFHQDMAEHFKKGQVAKWRLVFSIISKSEIKKLGSVAFDGTKPWPSNLTKQVVAGTLVLNDFPDDQFTHSELMALCPGNLCPGIELSQQDLMLNHRVFMYHDASLYRVGVNKHQLAVNCPMRMITTLQRGGAMDNWSNKTRGYHPDTENPVKACPMHKLKSEQIGCQPIITRGQQKSEELKKCSNQDEENSDHADNVCPSEEGVQKSDEIATVTETVTEVPSNTQEGNSGEVQIQEEDMHKFKSPYMSGRAFYLQMNDAQKNRLAENIAEDAVSCSNEVLDNLKAYLTEIHQALGEAVSNKLQAIIDKHPK